MYFNLHTFLTKRWENIQPSSLNVLDASGSEFLKPFADKLNITVTSYGTTDMHNTSFPDNTFDVVSLDQVLEHTYFPHLIFVEAHRILKPGGIAIFTTCAYNPVHESGGFHDLWRFQLDGLRALSLPYNGGILHCGSWGTADAISARAHHGPGSGGEQNAFREHFDVGISVNQPTNPFVVWIVVQK